MWANSGRELFYANEAQGLVAVQVTGDPTFAVGQREFLFPGAGFLLGEGQASFDVSADDQRFLMLAVGDVSSGSEIIWIEHWAEELKERVPN